MPRRLLVHGAQHVLEDGGALAPARLARAVLEHHLDDGQGGRVGLRGPRARPREPAVRLADEPRLAKVLVGEELGKVARVPAERLDGHAVRRRLRAGDRGRPAAPRRLKRHLEDEVAVGRHLDDGGAMFIGRFRPLFVCSRR